ncbi:uncharacterized protein LOC131031585 [Cryptomeria japonica]|uniref:uncharacterized protein LOC131031585 n=1 Tax=Cryptomeria japonica TaxID=3369 RepID=UPI0027DA226C|nr:uncharacterized protein LOC131031585 [Cryptomeria japonica]
MPRQKDFAWTHCTAVPGSTKVKCNWSLEEISGGIYRFEWHLSKERGNNTVICKACPADVSYQAKQSLDGIAESKAKKARIGVELGSSSADPRTNHLGEEDGEDGSFRESGLTHNSIARGPNTGGGNTNAFFQPRTTPGSQATLESTGWRKTVGMLKDAVEDVQDVVKQHRLQWARTGCSIMSDGWTDRRNRTLINFLVSWPQNVVQFFTDNAAACVAAGRLLIDKYPSMFFIPCAAHCLDLNLEDIGKIEWVKAAFQKAHKVTKFIYNHTRVLAIMRSFTGGKELVRPGVTRFATYFLALQTLCEQKGNLRRMFVSAEWMESGFTTQANGIAVAKYMYSTTFWESIEQIVEFSEPLVEVLRLVDGENPPMGYVYEAMDRAKEVIKSKLENNRDKYMPLWDIIDRRWDGQMHTPLHAAGYFLNPLLFYKTDFLEIDAEVK